jgi:hypothetical protein
VGLRASLDVLEKREICFLYQGSNPGPSTQQHSRYVINIPSTLLWFDVSYERNATIFRLKSSKNGKGFQEAGGLRRQVAVWVDKRQCLFLPLDSQRKRGSSFIVLSIWANGQNDR